MFEVIKPTMMPPINPKMGGNIKKINGTFDINTATAPNAAPAIKPIIPYNKISFLI